MAVFDKVFTIHYREYVGDRRYPLQMREVIRQHTMFADTEEQARARFLDTPGFYGYESRIIKIESESIEGSDKVQSFVM